MTDVVALTLHEAHDFRCGCSGAMAFYGTRKLLHLPPNEKRVQNLDLRK